MRFSYNWLKELSKTEKKPEELVDLVMLRGFELEEGYNLANQFDKFVVGEVKEVKKHPDADRLSVARVDLGQYGNDVQIVCGAPNLTVGQKVPVAMSGAILPHSKIEIKKTEVRGVESNGMICAEDEIGLGKDHQGIMVLDNSLKNGESLPEALGLKDTVLDFDILPNRAHDCLSYQGLAREIATMEGRKITFKNDLEIKYLEKGKLLNIEIEDEKLCPRYMGAVLKNIKLGESPDWMKARLVASGMEPINNVVDITNYVMLETGSPLHAFDFDGVVENERVNILVRKAKKGEKLELLSDDNLELNEEDLLITNGEKPLALAGIKGGKKSGINIKTNQIILEAANFALLTIRKSRQCHALTTESQARFEKGISPVLAEKALKRAVKLLKEYAGAELIEIVEGGDFEDKDQLVRVDFKKIEKLLGEKIEKKEAFKTLNNLGFEILNENNNVIELKVPYWRLDIEGQFDLAEEIGRIKGYEKIKPQALLTPSKPGRRNLLREFEWKVKDNLTAMGWDEVICYSFYGKDEAELAKISGEHFELENPNNESQNLMRRTLLPGAIQAGVLNQKNFEEFGLFEIGRVFFPEKKGIEELRLAGVYYNQSLEKPKMFYKAKEKMEAVLKKVLKQEVEFKSIKELDNNFFHLTRTADIFISDIKLGKIGEISPDFSRENKIKKPLIIFELNFNEIYKLQNQKQIFKKINKFPFVERDLAMFVEIKTEASEVKKIIKKVAGLILKEIQLFDIFEDNKNNKKSFAFHLKFGKENETLKGREVDERIKKIMEALEREGYEIRR